MVEICSFAFKQNQTKKNTRMCKIFSDQGAMLKKGHAKASLSHYSTWYGNTTWTKQTKTRYKEDFALW